jgi:hypothetical protein
MVNLSCSTTPIRRAAWPRLCTLILGIIDCSDGCIIRLGIPLPLSVWSFASPSATKRFARIAEFAGLRSPSPQPVYRRCGLTT